MAKPQARRVVFPARPGRRLEASDFRIEPHEVGELAPGQALVATRMLAIDPGVILRLMDRAPFAPPYRLGDVVPGFGSGVVLESRHADLAIDDVVTGPLGWQTVTRLDGSALEKWRFPDIPYEVGLTALGIPALTGYFGVRLAQVKAGDTVLISSAAGSVGMYAAQIARLRGVRVVGTAGGAEKCRWLTDDLRIDAAIDYKSAKDLVAALQHACQGGIDAYLDLVGGELLNAAVAVANTGARFVLCGALSEFDAEPGEQHGLRHLTWVIQKNLRLEGFTLFRFAEAFAEARTELANWFRAGEIRTRDEIFEGLEAAPDAFLGLLRGQGIGRRLIKITNATDV